MVCMVSSTGRTIDHSRLLWAHRTPSSTPIVTERTTEIPIRLRVSIAGRHMSTTPQKRVATTQKRARRRPPKRSAGSAMPSTTTTQGNPIRKPSAVSSATARAPAMPRVSQR